MDQPWIIDYSSSSREQEPLEYILGHKQERFIRELGTPGTWLSPSLRSRKAGSGTLCLKLTSWGLRECMLSVPESKCQWPGVPESTDRRYTYSHIHCFSSFRPLVTSAYVEDRSLYSSLWLTSCSLETPSQTHPKQCSTGSPGNLQLSKVDQQNLPPQTPNAHRWYTR